LSATRKIILGQSSLSIRSVRGVVGLIPVALHPDLVPEKYKADFTAYDQNASNVPMVDKTSMLQFFDIAGVTSETKDYFPAADLDCHGQFPPTYICTCEIDPVRDDGRVMIKSLRDAGVKTKWDHYDGLPHNFFVFPGLPETKTFMEQTFSGISWVIEQM